ncbi:methionyl-tRNA synthetase [Coemansia helicoidea]|uniref:Methionyl-tRNA synthetase n=1 Tax=Coemansia helicoidea TaxID=1286919 RepID=A0ACC1KX58_9FUNG|nr:methionyl-tRNA synthetase [Coemansia helicoidea]
MLGGRMYRPVRALAQAAAAGRTARLFTTARRLAAADKFYVTQPIFYVNSVPHIGHFYTIVLADAIKRYADLQGKATKLSAGTDEHGLKIQQAADKAGEEPLAFCTRFSDRFRALMGAANASNTDFIRTSEPRHREAVARFWRELVDRGHIYKGEHSGWYAVSDEAFYTEGQVEERVDPATGERKRFAIESGQPVEWVSEVNYKFRLSAFRDRLIAWIEESHDAIYPEIRRNEVLAWLRDGLEDLSVSRPRSRLRWGIPVPGDDQHTVYVWVDALINYATVDGYPWSDGGGATQRFFPPDVQVVGKDIVRFHAVYWPALLMAAGLPLPKRILAHAHWTMGAQKMSKSKGNVADPFDAIAQYGVDPIRYFILRNGGIADDGDYSPAEVLVRYKKDLVGQLANLAARCLSASLGADLGAFAAIGRQQRQDQRAVAPGDEHVRRVLLELPQRVGACFDKCELGRGMALVFDALADANRYMTDEQPWVLAKSADGKAQARLQVVLFYTLETVRLAAIMLQPAMPGKAAQLLDHLAVRRAERQWQHACFGAGWQSSPLPQPLPGAAQLFPKL